MNPENLKVLAERASASRGVRPTRLDEVHARIDRTRRRRQAGGRRQRRWSPWCSPLTAGVGLLALTEHRSDTRPRCRHRARRRRPSVLDEGPASVGS